MNQKNVPRLDRLFPDFRKFWHGKDTSHDFKRQGSLFHVQKLWFTDQISNFGIYTRNPLPVFTPFS